MKASFILLVPASLIPQMNGGGQSAQFRPAADMKTIGVV
jgi:hypothetical protein